MVFPLIPIAIGAAVAALMESCTSSQYDCYNPDELPVSNTPGPDEFVTVSGQHKIIADKNFSQKAVDTYLARVIQTEQDLETFFGFKSPWGGKLSLFLLSKNSPNNECVALGTSKCSVWGATIFAFSPAKLKDINTAIEAGLEIGPLVHEMSHALRFELVELPFGLEEGLAVYTETMLLDRNWPNIGKNTPLGVFIDYQCLELGYREIKRNVTKDGETISTGALIPYSKSAPFSASGEFYPDNFCFWDRIREQYGHTAIQAIVQAMVTYSQSMQGQDGEFPVFHAVRDATGMSFDEATAHFNRFSAPTDSASYPTTNGVCWK